MYTKVNVKKSLLTILTVILTSVCLTACGSGTKDASRNDDKLRIVTTIFPEYDWVQNILGDNPAGAEVTLLLDNGVDLHSYQPTAADILKISDCDLFIYVGGESDEWVEDALKSAANKEIVAINLLDTLGDRAKEEELVEGMECEEEENGEAGSENAGNEEEAPEYDEHVWLSLKNASVLVSAISDTLQTMDADNAETYKKNTEAYIARLDELDKRYAAAAEQGKVKTLLFGDRFPFRYLTDDYGLAYYAAFAGCSAETEASFETITFLAEKADELSLPCVMTIEGTDKRIAETIVQNTKSKDLKILIMDSMQSATLKDMQNGTSYMSIMEGNLEVLKEALD